MDKILVRITAVSMKKILPVKGTTANNNLMNTFGYTPKLTNDNALYDFNDALHPPFVQLERRHPACV